MSIEMSGSPKTGTWTHDDNPPPEPIGNSPLRLMQLLRSAEIERDRRLGEVFQTFDEVYREKAPLAASAVSTDSKDACTTALNAAAGEVIVEVTVANAVYQKRIAQALEHLGNS